MAFDPPIIDNFTGSNGSIDNRVSSAGPVWSAPLFTGDTAAAISSNAIPSVAAQTRGAVIDSRTYGPDVEMAVTITQMASGSKVTLFALSNGYATFPATYGDGNIYSLQIIPGGGGAPGFFSFHRDIGVSGVDLVDTATMSGGDVDAPLTFGYSIVEEGGSTRLTAYRKIAGVWTADPTTYLDSTGDRPSGVRYFAFEVIETGGDTVIFDDFSGQRVGGEGTTVSLPDVPVLGWLSS